MDRESYYETLYTKMNGRRGEELRELMEIGKELRAASRKMMALRLLFEETDRIVAGCAEIQGEPRGAQIKLTCFSNKNR